MKKIWLIAGWTAFVSLAANAPDGSRWWSHVEFLASDKLEGRNRGGEGHRKAAEYVAAQFERDGLKPAGEQGFIQPVKFITKQFDEARSSLTLERSGKSESVKLGEDAIIGARVDPSPSIEAELVFVGYGLRVPEINYDDFAALNTQGKIAVYLNGAPGRNDTEGEKIAMAWNHAHADELFAGTGHTLHKIVARSAHVDRLGIGAPVNGDAIFNGAMDNAAGVASMLDIAAHPTVPAKNIVADINVDEFLPLFPLKILTVYGLDESTPGDDIRAVAKQRGVRVEPDPARNVFIRSDRYNFVRHGIPAPMPAFGTLKGSPEEAALRKWNTERYHIFRRFAN